MVYCYMFFFEEMLVKTVCYICTWTEIGIHVKYLNVNEETCKFSVLDNVHVPLCPPV